MNYQPALTKIKNLLRTFTLPQNDELAAIKKQDRSLILKIKRDNLTYLSNKKLVSLVKTLREIETNQTPGMFIEAGCALGGSTILISKLKSDGRKLNVYDVFGMIPPPSEGDDADVHNRYNIIKDGKSKGINGDEYYGYKSNLYEEVQNNLKKYEIDSAKQNVSLIKGLLQDTMTIDEAVAFAHIDVDWYEPVWFSLERIVPKLAVGGAIILDDYKDWSGCRKAADDFFQNCREQFMMDDSYGSMKITKLI